MLEGQIVSISLKDFFTKKMLKIALLPLVVTMVIMLTLFYTAADYGFQALQQFIEASQQGQEVQVDTDAPFYFVWLMYVIAFLFKYSITSWLVGFLIYTVGTLFIMMFSVFLTLIIIGFLTPMILDIIHKRHYKQLQINGFGNLFSPLFILLKCVAVMIFLFIVLIPAYFIPVINLFAINLPFYYFFHKMLTFDVASTILTQSEYKAIHKKSANSFRLRTLFLYMLSMIPSITLFSAVFFVIYLGHAYFQELIKLNGDMDVEVDEKGDIRLLQN